MRSNGATSHDILNIAKDSFRKITDNIKYMMVKAQNNLREDKEKMNRTYNSEKKYNNKNNAEYDYLNNKEIIKGVIYNVYDVSNKMADTIKKKVIDFLSDK